MAVPVLYCLNRIVLVSVLAPVLILYCLNRAVSVPVFGVPKTKQTTAHSPRGLESLAITF